MLLKITFVNIKYKHKNKEDGEFIRIKFLPPGRIVIYKGEPEDARYIQILDHIPLYQIFLVLQLQYLYRVIANHQHYSL